LVQIFTQANHNRFCHPEEPSPRGDVGIPFQPKNFVGLINAFYEKEVW
jgi:hypothetical protein